MSKGVRFEELPPLAEACYALLTKLGEASLGLLRSLHPVKMALGVELVGIADQPFFQRLGQKILGGNRQVLCHDLRLGQSCARVSLADACVAWVASLAKQFCSQPSVADVGFLAVASYPRRIAEEDADIVEHGCLLYKRAVDRQFGMGIRDAQGPLRHLPTMHKENAP